MSSDGMSISLPLPPEIREKLRDMRPMSPNEQRQYMRELLQAAHEYNEKAKDDG